MPERGPAQLLLLFFSSRARVGWKVGLAAAAIALLGLLPGEEGVYHQAKQEIAQSFRQAAWKRALAGEPQARSWPWSEAEPVAYSRVPRLGLSAAVLHDDADEAENPAPQQSSDRHDPHLGIDVSVGDRITVTKSDGSMQSYRVKGFELLDAQDEASDEEPADPHISRSDSALAGVLRLIIEAVDVNKLEGEAATHEHKL